MFLALQPQNVDMSTCQTYQMVGTLTRSFLHFTASKCWSIDMSHVPESRHFDQNVSYTFSLYLHWTWAYKYINSIIFIHHNNLIFIGTMFSGGGGDSKVVPCGFSSPKCELASIHLLPSLSASIHLSAMFAWYFLHFFTRGFHILRYGDHGKDLELINLSWPWLNFQGHSRSLCF